MFGTAESTVKHYSATTAKAREMLRRLTYIAILAIPLLAVAGYAALLFASVPIGELTAERAGQLGDSFGVITCLFSGFAFSGVLITLLLQMDELRLQREEIKRSAKEHALSKRLTALAALLGVYHELADKNLREFDQHLARSQIPGATGSAEEKLKAELAEILRLRNRIYGELEQAAEMK
jgi:hypothetical protein